VKIFVCCAGLARWITLSRLTPACWLACDTENFTHGLPPVNCENCCGTLA
jgi:hypothetical protein